MEQYDDVVREDCKKLYDVLKNEAEGDGEQCLKILYRIIFLISCRQSLKMQAVTSFTVRYLCQHPTLPVILVEIIRETHNIKICAYVLEILAKLIIKNPTTPENDRKAIRRVFSDPTNFKSIVDAFQKVYDHFIHDKTNPLFYEIQLRLLKIINCLYIRKGQSQISTLTEPTVEFVGRHLTKYKAHKDISAGILPLVKLLCRNKRNCALMCNDNFLNSLASVVTATNKYPAAITILKLMSRSPEAVLEMSNSEKTFNFVLTAANNHTEKTTHKKHLMTTLYRISKNYAGISNITKPHLWLQLLEFFSRADRLDELKQRLAATKAYTILSRGVQNEVISVTPVKLNLGLSNEIQDYIAEKSNHHSDDSDNEESEDEDDNKVNKDSKRLRTSSEEESDDSEIESEDDDEHIDERPNNITKISEEDISYANSYYREFFSGDPEVFENKIFRNKHIDRLAFPDAVLAESDKTDIYFITPNINCFLTDEMARKIKVQKGLEEGHFRKRTVFDLDEVLDQNSNQIDVPEPDMFTGTDLESACKNKQTIRSIKFKRDPPALRFESRFECGNLRKAHQIGDYEYNLYLTPDINMTNGLQWFYFQVSNMLPGEAYVFNIVNFQKVNSQFIYGLQPVVFSTFDYLINSTGWKKAGENIVYYGNEFINDNDKQFRTLSFRLSFQYENDYCYIAYHFPYTYTRLMNMILRYQSPSDKIYSRIDNLTNTVNNLNQVPLITITSTKQNIPLEKRPLVFLTARVHPGESNASWIMDGVLQFLLDQQDERANKARDHYIFKIIPMLNPEGVMYGNSRCGLTGNDLNRCWKKPHPLLHPEIYYAKKLVQFAKERLDHPIHTFIDIHGHSRKKFFFLYGCNPKLSWSDLDKTTDTTDSTFNLLPKALSVNENMKMSFCRYTIERKREATCRVVMWREFGIKCSYTLECSFCSGENKRKMTTKMLRDIGISIIAALANIADTA